MFAIHVLAAWHVAAGSRSLILCLVRSLRVLRIPRWLFLLLLPLLFFGGCVASIKPAWKWTERRWIRSVTESDRPNFPVLTRGSDGIFAPASLGHMPSGSVVVTSGLDDPAINRDLSARIGLNRDHEFFRVLERSGDLTRVTLEVPTLRDSRIQSWYDVVGDQVVPRKIMRYGPGFAFAVIPVSAACGIAAVASFWLVVRPKRKPPETKET